MSTTNALDGTEIFFTDTGGDADPVILVHGITENSTFWAPVADRLTSTNRIIALDLRGHGQSSNAESYDLAAMASDVVAVAEATGVDRPQIVGHSLGGAVVSAVGAAYPVASVVNVDQSLQLGDFKEGLTPVEAMLRDPATFEAVLSGLFTQLAGTMLSAEEQERLTAGRRPVQEVVLGVWDLIFSMSAEEINGVVEDALSGYAGKAVPYLSLFGADPGPDYAAWLAQLIPGAEVELWDDHGHYPHLVNPDRFVSRLKDFWS